jgi:NAD(P)-dependent dehydrogenase (short-subunit alcohol dehydrogenase family)
MPVAVITGASRGLGRAVARSLAQRGWSLVLDARTLPALSAVADEIGATAIYGDVTDEGHRAALVTAADAVGGADVLINNASDLGVSPLPALAAYPLAALRRVYEVNLVAPLALAQSLLPRVGTIVNISSDAAVEAYPGWGGYGSSKAALDQLSAVMAAELPQTRVYAFDPGDMRTEMHQQAFPGEDISDRPEPETVVPALLRLIDEQPPSGRYRASDLALVAG